jgi:hypothetical protein
MPHQETQSTALTGGSREHGTASRRVKSHRPSGGGQFFRAQGRKSAQVHSHLCVVPSFSSQRADGLGEALWAGLVYSAILGHTWVGEPSPNLDCVGFQTPFRAGRRVGSYGGRPNPNTSGFPGAFEYLAPPVTECTGYIGDNLGPNGLSGGSSTPVSRSKYPKS